MNITLIGCGQMGSAIAIRLGSLGKHRLFCYDRIASKAQGLANMCGGVAIDNPCQHLSKEHVFLLAVKPQDITDLTKELKTLKEAKCLISILTGVTLSELEAIFPSIPILRMMPNMAVKYGLGILALTENPKLNPFKSEIEEVFQPLGKCIWFPEKHMDALTSLIGSGPAFIYILVEAMVDAAIVLGIKADEASSLMLQMVEGALATLKNSSEHPGELKWQVTSPGGTTIAGIRCMEKLGMRSAMIETFLAAYERARELNSQKSSL